MATTEKNIKTRLQLKTDTAENWAKATNFVPKKGEPIIYQDPADNYSKLKIGDEVHTVEELPFAADGSQSIYIGSGEPPASCDVQIDPSGEAITIEDITSGLPTILYTEQTLTEEQKTQTRNNIDACNLQEVQTLIDEAIANIPIYNGEIDKLIN